MSENLAEKIEEACIAIQYILDTVLDGLERQPLIPLADAVPESRAGAYVVYTKDTNGRYRVWALSKHPIYCGKAIDVADRVAQHATSINQASNLRIEDFYVRYVLLPDKFAHLACLFEAALLKRYDPFWNTGLKGFGLKDVGEKRTSSRVSDWDTLHPGRPNRGVTENRWSPEELETHVLESAAIFAAKHNTPLRYIPPREQCAIDVLAESLVLF